MQKVEVYKLLQRSKRNLFTFADMKRILKVRKDNYAYVHISRLVRSGLLKRLLKGVYYLTDKKPSDFEIANFLVRPSYISLESALNYYGILIQVPYTIFSVTPRRGRAFTIEGKEFIYQRIDQKYFTDFIKEKDFLIASPEKALIDSLFFSAIGKASIDFDELGFDLIKRKRFKMLTKKIKNAAFQRKVESI